jgi:hypothetical protein
MKPSEAEPSLRDAAVVCGKRAPALRCAQQLDRGNPMKTSVILFVVMVMIGSPFLMAQTNLHSITLPGYVVVTNSPGGGGGSGNANLSAAGIYVDYSAGNDSLAGTNIATAWKHCPGDPAATGNAAACVLQPGTNVYFKAGVTYTLVGNGNPLYQTGIGLNWSGTSTAPITYSSSTNWGNGQRAIFTDGYTSNYIAAFYAPAALSNIVLNNLEIGPLGGSATLPPDPGTGVPPRNGYGVFLASTYRNITVANCYFHNLGYTFNTIPMDANSVGIGADNRVSSAGVQINNTSGSELVITNCEFTYMHTGIDLAWGGNTSNIVVTANSFHDFMVWGIDIAGIAGNLDYLSVVGNTFSAMGWAYSPPNWTGYNYIPATCTNCFAGGPHQDPIFLRTSNTNVTCGAHNNIYNNVFQTTHPNEVFTADIYLEYAPSVNIYNNLFNNPNAGLFTTGQNIYTNSTGIITTNSWNGGGAPAVEISYELNQGGTIRILNNTIIVNLTNSAETAALLWGACGCLSPPVTWPSNAFLQVENNLSYSWATNGTQGSLLVLGVVTNQYPVSQWTVDYNGWRSRGGATDPYFWWNNQPGFNLNGGLATERAVGFDAHGITNDPQFVSLTYGTSTNSPGNNYTPQAGSPIVGVGTPLASLTNLPGITLDITGKPRTNYNGGVDLGAYQH